MPGASSVSVLAPFVAMPFVPSSFLLLVVRPGAPSSPSLLLVMPGATLASLLLVVMASTHRTELPAFLLGLSSMATGREVEKTITSSVRDGVGLGIQ